MMLMSVFQAVDYDTVWGYGFSYNIASGLIPYRDYNMVVGPLYSLIFAIPMYFFGNYLIAFKIGHALVFSIIFLFMYKKIGTKSIFVLLVFMFNATLSRYNAFCSMLLLAIFLLYDSKNKYKQIYIGILIGAIFMTKHNIGIPLMLVYIYDNRKNLLNALSFLIPIVPTVIYLIINNAFSAFINFCYLGMSSFIDNVYIQVVTVFILLVCYYFVYKVSLKKRDTKLLYLIAFQAMLVPILDGNHLTPTLLPIIYYIFYYGEEKLLHYFKIIIVDFFVVAIIVSLMTNTFNIKKDFLMYTSIHKGSHHYIEKYNEYINKHSDYDFYIFDPSAYLMKLYRNENPTFLDLTNTGNMGKDEQSFVRMLDKECSKKKCMYVLSLPYFENKKIQNSKLFKDYVLEHATYYETLPTGDRVYVNKKNES